MEFIKVLCVDDNLADSICIVNKEDIICFELLDFYQEDFTGGRLYIRVGNNVKKLFVTEGGIKQLQKDLLNKTIKPRTKAKITISLDNVDKILNPNSSWDKTVGVQERIAQIMTLTTKYKEEIAKKIKLMSYPDFLQTPYWKAISVYKKIEKGCCEICGNKFELYTHHKTYEHHGYEILHLNDLQVLCGLCHHEIHKGDKNNG